LRFEEIPCNGSATRRVTTHRPKTDAAMAAASATNRSIGPDSAALWIVAARSAA
jgi:hypothetical protein